MRFCKYSFFHLFAAVAIILPVFCQDLRNPCLRADCALYQKRQAQYEDVRCKCVCPEVTAQNGTVKSKPVYVKTVDEPNECSCEHLVQEEILEEHVQFCNLCECRWERRNTRTMQVVVIIIICLISLLVLYMLFLLCLDPLVTRHQRAYREHENEEVNMDTGSVHVGAASPVRSRAPRDLTSRLEHEVSRVRGAQQKWVGQVQEQRRNIYDRHSMLN